MKLVYKSVERPAAKPAQPPRRWGKSTVLQVLVEDVKYVSWCLENVSGFVLDTDAQEAYEAFKE